MALLIVAVTVCAICKLISAASAKAKEEARKREITRLKEEQDRVQQWQMEQERQAKKEAKLRAEQEAAIAQAERDMILLRREQERQAKEQERQAAQLAKHEAEIEKLKHTVEVSTSDIEFLLGRMADLEYQLDFAIHLQSGTIPGSKEHTRYQSKIVTLRNQIHTAESKLSNAQWRKEQAEARLIA